MKFWQLFLSHDSSAVIKEEFLDVQIFQRVWMWLFQIYTTIAEMIGYYRTTVPTGFLLWIRKNFTKYDQLKKERNSLTQKVYQNFITEFKLWLLQMEEILNIDMRFPKVLDTKLQKFSIKTNTNSRLRDYRENAVYTK